MPATTRSSTRQRAFVASLEATIRNNPVILYTSPGGQGQNVSIVDIAPRAGPANHRKQWTVTDQRTLIRMCRHTEMTPAIMAATLGRSEESIRYRLARLIHEHLDGRTDEASIREVSDWLLPN